MSKNKIIFAILWVVLAICVLFLVLSLRWDWKQTTTTSQPWDVTIWLYKDDAWKFQDFLTEFKNDTESYTNKTIKVESFSDYKTYHDTLVSATLQWQAPDMFVLNNNETSVLENQIQWIDPNFISPNDFRKVYMWVFGDDLIQQSPDDPTLEFLKGIPMGYESLWVYFNRRNFKTADFESWTSLNSSLEWVTQKDSSLVPIALWGENILNKSDIIAQMFLSLGAKNIVDTSGNTITQAFQTYLWFWDRRGDNGYESLSNTLQENNLDYFARGDVAAVIWYPSMLEQIENKWFPKNFLLASPVPQYASQDNVSLVNYNYFVLNKDTQNIEFLNDLLAYMVSDDGIEAYMEQFPYAIPASLKAQEDVLERKIDPDFNIVYKDFIRPGAEASSYDTGNLFLFERAIDMAVYDTDVSDTVFEKQKWYIICSTNKSQNLINLSSSCK